MIALKLLLITAAWGSFLAAISPDMAYDFFLAVICCFV